MAKKRQALADWISAHDAAQLLSSRYERPISPKYVRLLSKRKKNPVRTQEMSNRLLYSKEDLEDCEIRHKAKRKLSE